MAEATTNLQYVAADRLSIFHDAKSRHEDVRDIFLNVAQIVDVTELSQQVGDKSDTILTYPSPASDQVPS